MAVRKCVLCGGNLDEKKICTECGMDNKKNDQQYVLNENLQPARSVGSRREPQQREPRLQHPQQRKNYSWPPAGNRNSFGGSSMACKVVFLIVLAVVIGTAVLGFLQDKDETVRYSGHAENILDQAPEAERSGTPELLAEAPANVKFY